jgi:hypothetical protein
MLKKLTRFLALVPLAFPPLVEAQSEDEVVLSVVQRFFDADAAKDVEAAREIMIPEGRFFSVREDKEEKVVQSFTIEEYLDGLPSREEAVLERMWDPRVMIHRDIAVVWTRFDFHRNGRFSHCGVDSFDLIKTREGWKISGGIYTVEPTDCPESPLGPPR